jgi:TctA family transporter
MGMILGIIVGILVGTLSLIPGVHPASLLLFILPLVHLGSDGSLAVAAVSIGVGCVLNILHVTYHPVSRSMLAHADVAAKMAYQGYGKAVVRLHSQSVWTSTLMVAIVTCVLVGSAMLGWDMAKGLNSVIKTLNPFILTLVVGLTVWKSKRKVRTALICICAGLLGFMAFNLPAVRGSEWTMLPLLGGLFMAPAAASLLFEAEGMKLPDEVENRWDEITGSDATGAVLGIITGFLAGVGTSSLVNLFREESMDEEEMVQLGSAGETSNAMFALLAFTLIGTTRSGTAAAVANVAPSVDPLAALLCLALMVFGVMVGQRLLKVIHEPYKRLMWVINQKTLACILLTLTGITVLSKTGLSGTIIFFAAWLLSSQAKKWYVPNQSLLVSLIGPVLIYYTGCSGALAISLGLG